MSPVRSSRGALVRLSPPEADKESENCPSTWQATGLSNGVNLPLCLIIGRIGHWDLNHELLESRESVISVISVIRGCHLVIVHLFVDSPG